MCELPGEMYKNNEQEMHVGILQRLWPSREGAAT